MTEADKAYPPAKYRLKLDNRKCQLCQSCVIYCSMFKWSEVSPLLGCMDVDIDYWNGDIDISFCYQCSAPSCANVCRFDAIRWDEERGCMVTDQEACTGCGLCADACPKHAISFNKPIRKAAKCNLCGECVEVCPGDAITMVPLNKYGREITPNVAGGARK